MDLVRSIGADDVIDYTRDDFAGDARRYDLVLDTLVIVSGEGGDRVTGGMGRHRGRARRVEPGALRARSAQ